MRKIKTEKEPTGPVERYEVNMDRRVTLGPRSNTVLNARMLEENKNRLVEVMLRSKWNLVSGDSSDFPQVKFPRRPGRVKKLFTHWLAKYGI